MSAVEVIASLFQSGALAKMEPLFREAVTREARSPRDLAYDIYLNLYRRGVHEVAMRFILTFCNSFAVSNELIFEFGKKIYSEQDKDIGANLLMTYINNDGTDIIAYEVCISYCMTKKLYDFAISLDEMLLKKFSHDSLSIGSVFNIGTSYMSKGDFGRAFSLFRSCLERDADFEFAKMNIGHLALTEGYAEAVDWLRQNSNEIAGMALADRALPSGPVAAVVTWTGAERELILDSVSKNGFCFIRQGCDPATVSSIQQHMLALHDMGTVFPINFTEQLKHFIEPLFLFDAPAMMLELTGRPFVVDDKLCVGRRVNPEKEESFVPFHQDSTAFHKSLFNIWTPMTPAGGDFPSVQFVRKLITIAEQTRIFQGEYNLIEIEADYVAEKYGDLLYEIADAQPGDCVLFYGTTIHRSCNLERAILPRYNIEVRWSLA